MLRCQVGGFTERTATFETNRGTFQAERFEERAPRTTGNFIKLAEKGFYDSVVFHRVIDGFMIQGGDPTGTGRGGPGYTIDDEFHSELTHDSEGMLSMANAGPDTGGSQFFVTLAATPWLDGSTPCSGRSPRGWTWCGPSAPWRPARATGPRRRS